MKKQFFALLLMLCAIISAPAQISGKCIRVVDGDTYIFVTSKKDTLKVRDAYINTPETKNPACSEAQPFSAESTRKAKELLLENTFKIRVLGVDSYGRTLAYAILPNGNYYHRVMLNSGYAWSYLQNGKNFYRQQWAQAQKIGLWQYPNPINPSVWLRTHSTHKK